VGSRICPRLNAAGFMDGNSVAYAVLKARSEDGASPLLATVEQRYRDRQELARRVLDRSMESVKREQGSPVPLAVAYIDASEAVVAGIVAGKLAQSFGTAALVLHRTGGQMRGTLRAMPNCSLVDALIANQDLLDQFGGHAQAAGFTTTEANVETLISRMREYVRCVCSNGALPELRIDAEVSPYEVDWQLFWQLQVLEPFGAGNRAPLLLCRKLRVHDCRAVSGAHLQLTLKRGNIMLHAFAYGRARLAGLLRKNQEIDVLFTLELAERDGEPALQLRVQDLDPDPA
jgi:single-stranded-DNA-specific exonuclease